jgi:hypothetical protein
MSTRLVVDNQKGLTEINDSPPVEQPPLIRWMATLISYIFHPVFVPVYVVMFMVYLHPFQFTGFSPAQKIRIVMMSAVSFTFFPLVTVLLLKALKFIDTIYLHTQKDRIIPIIACMIWYFWVWYVWKNFGKTNDSIDMPLPLVQFAFATFLSTVIALLLNVRMKISLHAISMGILSAFFCLLAFTQELNFSVYLSAAIFITGLVCASRLIVSNHKQSEVYGGLLAGIISMLIAWWWMV